MVGEASAPPSPGEHRADDESEQEHAVGIDADGLRGLAILCGGEDELADHRMAQEKAQPEEQADRDQRQQDQLVDRVGHAKERHVAKRLQRAGLEIGLRAPDETLNVLKDHEHRERDQKLQHLGLVVDAPQQQPLDWSAQQHAHQDRRHEHQRESEHRGEAEREEEAGQRDRGIGPDRVERAMGNIQDAHHAEDQGQSERDDEYQRRVGDSVEKREPGRWSGS